MGKFRSHVYNNDKSIQHIVVAFVPESIDSQFNAVYKKVDGTPVHVKIDKYGIGCYQWLHRGVFNKALAERFSFASFTSKVHSSKETDPLRGYKLLSHISNMYREMHTLAKPCEYITLHIYGNVLTGITREYNTEIRGVDVYEAIVNNGMEPMLVDYWVDTVEPVQAEHFALNIKGETSVVVTNGFSGHFQLSYNVRTKFGASSYEHIVPFSRNKHLNNLNETFSNLKDAIGVIRANNLTEKLATISMHDFIGKITSLSVEIESAHRLMNALNEMRERIMTIDPIEFTKLSASLQDAFELDDSEVIKLFVSGELPRGDVRKQLMTLGSDAITGVIKCYSDASDSLSFFGLDSVPMLIANTNVAATQNKLKGAFTLVTDHILNTILGYGSLT